MTDTLNQATDCIEDAICNCEDLLANPNCKAVSTDLKKAISLLRQASDTLWGIC